MNEIPGHDQATQDELAKLVASDQVVLFMKGSRGAPQCGFSATVVEILDRYVPEYTTIDVLANHAIREGIKKFSDWPTIPQLYVRGEFLGGCDIVRQMDAEGELLKALGSTVAKIEPPAVTVTDAAAAVFRQASAEGDRDDDLRVTIDAAFRHDLSLGPSQEHDVAVITNGIKLVFDPASARRAAGLVIDYVEQPQAGFKLDNPNAPVKVEQASPAEVKAWLDAGEPMRLLDVRTPAERNTAHIEGSTLVTGDNIDELMALPKDTKLVFYCHHGMRSFQAAQHFAQQGFRKLWNMSGGIDAWSQGVDSDVPRY
ncbi:Grx4 family monothiol glutaredoxin [Paraliomyxa miuraensis]|uniref:Grx4 family monothiol glutaredoxin n=1 Tax=Paraliomyxa miuraensis TaxID=376150 RepID=UPI00225B233B|nr:Grx4 family monothiol glutaredoxin [Paraliomyxa miuraensis]MCX4241621.1 Grx4 family monothiol glutaredoxin [Paraliomyxa miuraensis]